MADVLQAAFQFASDHWITLLVGFSIILYYWHWVSYYTVFTKLGITGPTPLPLLGNTRQTLLNPNFAPKLHVEWCAKYGRVFGMYFFRTPFLMVADPEMIKEILVKEFQKFHDRKLIVNFPKPYDRMLTLVPGQKWKDIRTTLTPTFSASKMKQMMTFMNESVDTFIDKVDKISETGEIVDFHKWLQSLTMEVILSTAFGVRAETQTTENDPITERAKKVMTPKPIVGLTC